jgi:hypothetical protein
MENSEVPQCPPLGQPKNAMTASRIENMVGNQLSEACNKRRDLQT